jgi:hypothetical protein
MSCRKTSDITESIFLNHEILTKGAWMGLQKESVMGLMKMKYQKTLALCVGVSVLVSAGFRAMAEPVKIILDVDLCEDVDDAGAVATLHALANRGEAEILATLVSSRNEWVAPCLDAINTYYGLPDVPIGYQRGLTYGYRNEDDPKRSLDSKYAEHVAKAFPHDLQRSSDAPDAALLCRKILAGQPDGSVTFVTVGFLTNLRDLLDTQPDEYSELNGEDLVRKKVKQWVCMGGLFPNGEFPNGGGEYNLMWDTTASVRAVNDWPTQVVFSGFWIGVKVKTGSGLKATPESNPVRLCYHYYNDLTDRESWDQTAVLYAVRGAQDNWKLSEPGICIMHARVRHGYNQWIPYEKGQHRYLIEDKAPEQVAAEIEALMVQPPRK